MHLGPQFVALTAIYNLIRLSLEAELRFPDVSTQIRKRRSVERITRPDKNARPRSGFLFTAL